MAFQPSKYQKAVYTYMLKGKGNAVVDAVAGSGKSTTIVNALKLIPSNKSVLFLAFNKSIVEELKKKVGPMNNVEISTLHSLGARAMRKVCNSRINSSKVTAYVNQRMEDNQLQSPAYEHLTPAEKATWRKNVFQLLDLGRVNLVDTKEGLTAVAEKHDIDIVDNEIDVVPDLIKWSQKNIKEIDFTDMIYLPVVLNVRMDQYDWVFIDECQDLNAAQRELFLKCVKPNGGRFIAVGDEKQAIYGFSGADAESFKKLRNLPNTVKLPLSICYRCDQLIIQEAKELVPQIYWRDGALPGEINRAASIEDVVDGDMILCRITAPLVKLCMRYIRDKKKAYVKGRDIGANLIHMIESTKQKTIAMALEIIAKDLGKIVAKLITQHIVANEQEATEHPKYVALKDKIECIEMIAEGLIKSKDVVERIRQIFADDNGEGICLSTIHKSKGLENDRVFIICPDKLPLKGCMKIEWMAEQEMNLKYVAITRAKHYLGIVQDFS